MKKLILSAIALTFLSFSYAQTKRALIVAVGQYAKKADKFSHMNTETGYWPDISSVNDVPLIKGALYHHGFEEDNITTIKNKQATQEGILKAIRQLIEDSEKKDIVVFHYSGHGQQIMDDNGDEIDGYDEAMVPYDAPSKYKKGVYVGEKHIRDDKVGELMTELRSKLGPDGHLLIVFDACHSGTATRGTAKARGTKEIMAPSDYKPREKSGNNEFGIGGDENDNELSPFVFFSGSSSRELNYETYDEENKSVGSLSYCFSRAVINAEDNTTYENLFNAIRSEMGIKAPKQTPQVEGAESNVLFDGAMRLSNNYYIVKSVMPNKNILLEGGSLRGLHKGAEVTFYDIKDVNLDDKNKKATGKVVGSRAFEAAVELDTPLKESEIIKSKAYVTQKSFGNLKLGVNVIADGQPEIKKYLEEQLSNYKLLELGLPTSEISIIYMDKKGSSNDSIIVVNSYENILLKEEIKKANTLDERVTSNIINSILSHSQAKFLKNLEMSNPKINVKLNLIPVTVSEDAFGASEIKELEPKEFTKNGTITLEDDEYFIIEVENNGPMPVYLTVLDISPNNNIEQLFPPKEGARTKDEFYIESGDTIKYVEAIFQIQPPYGIDNLKVIATEKPINLKSVITSRGVSSRGNKNANPFEILLGETYRSSTDSKSRSGSVKVATVPPADGSISNVFFKIVPKGGRGE